MADATEDLVKVTVKDGTHEYCRKEKRHVGPGGVAYVPKDVANPPKSPRQPPPRVDATIGAEDQPPPVKHAAKARETRKPKGKTASVTTGD